MGVRISWEAAGHHVQEAGVRVSTLSAVYPVYELTFALWQISGTGS